MWNLGWEMERSERVGGQGAGRWDGLRDGIAVLQ